MWIITLLGETSPIGTDPSRDPAAGDQSVCSSGDAPASVCSTSAGTVSCILGSIGMYTAVTKWNGPPP